MKPSRLALLLASLLATSAAIGASCSFPEITFQKDTMSSGAGSGSDTAAAAGGGSDEIDAATGSGGASGSSSSSSGPPPCVSDAGPCDCDGDGDESWECEGGDCADFDSRAHTMADFVPTDQPIEGPRKPVTPEFDFNCNGSVEGEIQPLPECSALLGLNCKGSGYLSPVPACGGLANLAHCTTKGLDCVTVNDNIAKIQGCR